MRPQNSSQQLVVCMTRGGGKMQLQEKIKSSRNINPQIWLLRTLFSISREAKNFAKQGQWGSGGGSSLISFVLGETWIRVSQHPKVLKQTTRISAGRAARCWPEGTDAAHAVVGVARRVGGIAPVPRGGRRGHRRTRRPRRSFWGARK